MCLELAFIVCLSISEAEGRVHSLALYRLRPRLQLNIVKHKNFLQQPVVCLILPENTAALVIHYTMSLEVLKYEKI